jgi:hypothetical protein
MLEDNQDLHVQAADPDRPPALIFTLDERDVRGIVFYRAMHTLDGYNLTRFLRHVERGDREWVDTYLDALLTQLQSLAAGKVTTQW